MRSCSQLLRRTLIGGLLSWSFGVGQAVAEVQMDGHQLAQMCQNSNSSNHEYCEGFIVGVLHHAQASGDLCMLPKNVTEEELRLALFHAIETLPHAYRGRPAVDYVVGTITKNYCE